MKRIISLVALGLMGGVWASAQVPRADLFLGYANDRTFPARNLPDFTSNGGLGTLGINFNDYIGAEFEFGGYHNGNINNIQFDTTWMTYLFGPRLSLGRSETVDPYIHALFGGIHMTSSIFVPPAPGRTEDRVGTSQDAFAMAVGGGLDIKLTKVITLRPIQLDYLLTRLQDLGIAAPSENRNQHNLRYAAGIMFTFGGAQ